MPDANIFAYLVLYLWVPIAVALFFVVRAEVAATIALYASLLLLPEVIGIAVPGLPLFSKQRLTIVCVLMGCLLTCPRALGRARFGRGIDALFWLFLVGAFGTWLTNDQPVKVGAAVLPALSTADLRWFLAQDLFDVVLPFFLGRALFRDPRQLAPLLTVLAVAGLGYSLLALFEIRFSPQLHNWVYGFQQHSFAQTRRLGGFRPLVFTSHGLTLAKFMAAAVVACFALRHLKGRALSPWGRVSGGYLYAVLVACKSLGALIYATFLLLVMWVCAFKGRLRVAAFLGLLTLALPVLRGTQLFPVGDVVELAASYSHERAQSLEFRFVQEDALLIRARDRPWFGWGGFGRNRVRDLASGKDVSVTDGAWIIILGSRGSLALVGYLGLLTLPLLYAWRRRRWVTEPGAQAALSALALIVAIYALDEIPNSSGGLPLHFLAGALMGCCQGVALNRRRVPTPAI